MKLKLFFLSILAIFAPIKGAIITVGVLIFSDFILGVLASRTRKEEFTSEKMRRTISKMLIFEACLILAFITEVYLIGGIIPISKIAAGYIGLVEFQSIVENLNEINGSPVFVRLLSLINKKQEDIDDEIDPPAKE